MVGQHMGEPASLRRQALLTQAEEDDPVMGSLLTKDELPEVSIVRDKDSFLSIGQTEHITVVNRPRIIMDYGSNVVAQLSQIGGERIVGALVQQKLHVPVESASVGSTTAGKTSSPSTRA